MKESGLPPFLNEPTLEVQTPSGKQTLPNPFLGYTIDRWGQLRQGFAVALDSCAGTVSVLASFALLPKHGAPHRTSCASHTSLPCLPSSLPPRSSIPFPPYDSCKSFMSMLLPNTTNLGCTTSRDDWDRINDQVGAGDASPCGC